jgi:hypothetical protein
MKERTIWKGVHFLLYCAVEFFLGRRFPFILRRRKEKSLFFLLRKRKWLVCKVQIKRREM